jgi:predicted ester cyclase
MKQFAISLCSLVVAVGFASCGESQQKGQASNALVEEANIKIVRSFYEFLDKQDSTSLEKIIDEDFALYFGSYEEPMTFKQLKPLIKEVYFAFPDYKHDIEIIFASGQYVTVKVKQVGTHSDTYMGIKPTQKRISYKALFIFKLAEGLITEAHGMEDDLAALIKTE